jgi:hypothetical protein
VFHSTCLYLVPIACAHFACPDLIPCPLSEWPEFGSTLVIHFFCKCHPRITRTRNTCLQCLRFCNCISLLATDVYSWASSVVLEWIGEAASLAIFLFFCDIKTCADLLRVIFSCRNLEVWESSCI